MLELPEHGTLVHQLDDAVDELRAAHAWSLTHDVGLAVRLVGRLALYVECRMVAEVPRWAERTLLAARERGFRGAGQALVYGVAAAGARFAGDLPLARTLVEAGLAEEPDPEVEASAVLLGALRSRARAAEVFGDDAARLREATATLTEHLGPDEVCRLGARRAAFSDDEVVAHACAALAEPASS